MTKNLGQTLVKFFRGIVDFFLKTDIGRILGLLTAVVVFLKTIGVWENVLKSISSYLNLIGELLLSRILEIPLYFWGLSLLLLVWLVRKNKYLKLVSGEFFDDFRQGLGKWEFGGEGWKVEYEDGEALLSVSESMDGGISKRGFSWTDYEFSFDMKLISQNAGWIVRAASRSKFIMIQLNLEDENNPLLRLHYKVPRKGYQWIVAREDKLQIKRKIKLLEWKKIRVVVFGSNIDIYIEGEHAAHYFIADPIRFFEKVTVTSATDKKQTTIPEPVTLDYLWGKIGFRCAPPDEHAHFRSVKVKPLF